MKLPILLAVFALMALLRWRKAGMLAWLAVWWGGMFVILRYGMVAPVPFSVIQLYMGIVTLSLFVYVLTDGERIEEVRKPVVAFIIEPKFRLALLATLIALPLLAAWTVYSRMNRNPQPPTFARTVHPAPPDEITVSGTEFALGTIDNPHRALEETDPAAFRVRLESGRKVYYENCFYCHGDLMAGEGMYAHALNPLPTDFQDPGTIGMLREAFLFWRIAKGAPGLPEEGGPWQSAMPAWESFLDQDEMWNVILFLYEFTEQRPRAVELH